MPRREAEGDRGARLKASEEEFSNNSARSKCASCELHERVTVRAYEAYEAPYINGVCVSLQHNNEAEPNKQGNTPSLTP